MAGSFVHASGRPPDGQILRLAASGDQDAWDAIVDRHAGLVWAVAHRRHLSRSAASEVSRLTWMRLCDQLDRISPNALASWLEQTAERESIRMVRLSHIRAEDEARPA